MTTTRTRSADLPVGEEQGSPFALGLLLRQAHDLVAVAIDGALASFGIERRHLMVMMRLMTDGPTTQRDLVERTNHDKASMVRIVDDLERLGLASRELIEGDRRLRAVTLSDHGREIYGAAAQAAQPAAEQAVGSLTARQVDQLEQLLRTMTRR